MNDSLFSTKGVGKMSSGCKCTHLAGQESQVSPRCIGQLWLFEGLSAEEKGVLVEKAFRRIYAPGEAIFHQGDPADRMFLIKAGRVKLNKILEEGSEILLDIRKSGDFLGEGMLSDSEAEFPASGISMQETLICGFTREIFNNMITEHPNIGLQVIRQMGQQLDSLTARVGSMVISNLEERLYLVLSNVAKEHGRPEQEGYVINFPITHEDLGFLVGAHRVSITRAMKALKDAGKIVQKDRNSLLLPFY